MAKQDKSKTKESNIENMSDAEVQKKLNEAHRELFDMKINGAMLGQKKPHLKAILKSDIARLKFFSGKRK